MSHKRNFDCTALFYKNAALKLVNALIYVSSLSAMPFVFVPCLIVLFFQALFNPNSIKIIKAVTKTGIFTFKQ